MSSNTTVPPGAGGASAVRSLPATPSLEYERKQAKALLRDLRAGNPEALARGRAHHAAFRLPGVPEVVLADAQLIIAREYGFTSWPRMVRYFTTLEREWNAYRSVGLWRQERYDQHVAQYLAGHAKGITWSARAFASYVPRFYGHTIAEVLASAVTRDDAELVVAREHHMTSWARLVAYAAEQRAHHEPWAHARSPRGRAIAAIQANDLPRLQAIVRERPELLTPTAEERRTGSTLLTSALAFELTGGADASRLTEWLESQGLDRTAALEHMLFQPAMPPDVKALVARGAKLTAIAPNGLTLLEHALLHWHRDRAAVDFVAARVSRPNALWIAAALGDVNGVESFFARDGSLTAAAHRNRPPLELMLPINMPTLPEADDLEVMAEAALIATWHGQAGTLRVLIEHGYPVDHIAWAQVSLLFVAVEHRKPEVVELLISLGANAELRLPNGNYSPRQIAKFFVENLPTRSDASRRIATLCGAGDPEQLIAAADAERARQRRPGPAQSFSDALELAGDDALRCAEATVRPEHLLVGALRSGSDILFRPLTLSGVDLERLSQRFEARLLPATERLTREKIPATPATQTAIEQAVELAAAREAEVLHPGHLLEVLIAADEDEISGLLASAGADLARLREELARDPFAPAKRGA